MLAFLDAFSNFGWAKGREFNLLNAVKRQILWLIKFSKMSQNKCWTDRIIAQSIQISLVDGFTVSHNINCQRETVCNIKLLFVLAIKKSRNLSLFVYQLWNIFQKFKKLIRKFLVLWWFTHRRSLQKWQKVLQ